MITVIIPTLWLSDVLDQSLQVLNNNKFVKEIFVIDNRPTKRNVDFEKFGEKQFSFQITSQMFLKNEQYGKIRGLSPERNIYVSKAWNVGAELATHPYLCILNDDIVLPDNVFEFALSEMTEQTGIIGIHSQCLTNTTNVLSITPVAARPMGFGCCMFINRDKYKPIPDSIQIWYNDDYLLSRVLGQHYSMQELKVSGSISKSVNNPEMQDEIKKIIEQDRKAYTLLTGI